MMRMRLTGFDSGFHPRRFSVTTLAFTAPGTLSHAVYINKYLKLGFLKVPKAVTTTQVVVSEVSLHPQPFYLHTYI